MPKQKITKEMVVGAAFEIARTQGLEAVMVKEIARKLNCSVQPIYSYCSSMEGLRQELMEQTNGFVKIYVSEHVDKGDFFRSTGHTYVRLAKEEPHIFRMFVAQERKGIDSLESLYLSQCNPDMVQVIADNLHLSVSGAKRLHMNMMVYTIGIATILASTYPGIATEEIYRQIDVAYHAFVKQAEEDGDE